jgi:hypothetical protein
MSLAGYKAAIPEAATALVEKIEKRIAELSARSQPRI